MKRFIDRVLGRGDGSTGRRRSPHDPVPSSRASLLWRGEGRACSSRARLLNIRRTWDFVIADRQPPVGQAVWVRVEKPAPTEWAEATVVGRAGQYRVALEFRCRKPEGLTTT
jgi:hypothetical protein